MVYSVIKEGKVGYFEVKTGQVLLHDGRSADVKQGEKYLAVAVTISEKDLQAAVNSLILGTVVQQGELR
jgi:hypothetical protein